MSLWEYKQIRKQISDKGNEYISEHQIYEALTEMRDLIEDSSKKTKSARRQSQRQKAHAKSQTIVAKTIMASKRNNANTASDLEPTNSDDIQTDLQPSIQASKKSEKSVIEQNGLLLDTTDFDFGDIE
jgi:putative transposase